MRGFIYLLGSEKFGWYKIGRAKSAQIRVRTLGILLPFKIRIFAVWETNDSLKSEQEMHLSLAEYHLNGEWFSMPFDMVRELINKRHDGCIRTFPQKGVGENWGERFSNLAEDVTSNSYAKVRHREVSLRFSEAVQALLNERGLPPTPENLRLVRKEVRKSLHAKGDESRFAIVRSMD